MAYAGVDMQHQHRIHVIASVSWPRCAKVDVKDETLHCELALNRDYDLIDAYPKDPHIQFLNCQSAADIEGFTKTWGPLYLVQTQGNEDLKVRKLDRRLDEWMAHRRWLRSVKGLIDACRSLDDERKSLVEYLVAENDMERTGPGFRPGQQPLAYLHLRSLFRHEGNTVDWAESAPIGIVRKALASSLQICLTAPAGYGVRVEESKGKFEIKPSFGIGNLWEALRWMLWFDEWNQWPPIACLECHKIFRPLTAHKIKYCTHKCAHRATNREWRRKDLRRKKEIGKKQERGGTNVTRKTR